jgi:hypothetical protein
MIVVYNLTPIALKSSLEIFSGTRSPRGAVHGISPEQVFFHEVGAVDAIIIVGTCLGMDWLRN